MPLQLKETENLREFVDFPYGLFRKNPYWTGDLKKDVLKLLCQSHPFWRHAEKKLYMAFDGGRPVGRLAAIINHNHNSFHNEKCGFFGFFDCEDDQAAASALFSKAGEWLRAGGMDFVRGPANPSSNEVCGMLVEGFDSQNLVMMPCNPEYYLKLVENSGFEKEKDLLAFKWLRSSGFPERFERMARRALRDGKVKVEMVDVKNLDGALTKLKDIYNSAWEKNWGFVPMTAEEIDRMAADLGPVLKPEYLFFASVDGAPAAFALLLPDFNIALKGLNGRLTPLNLLPFLYKMKFKLNRGRLLTLGVKKEYRNRGLELLLIRRAYESARKLKWEYGELSWTLEDNEAINSVIEAIGGFVYKKYRIYRKKL